MLRAWGEESPWLPLERQRWEGAEGKGRGEVRTAGSLTGVGWLSPKGAVGRGPRRPSYTSEWGALCFPEAEWDWPPGARVPCMRSLVECRVD